MTSFNLQIAVSLMAILVPYMGYIVYTTSSKKTHYVTSLSSDNGGFQKDKSYVHRNESF